MALAFGAASLGAVGLLLLVPSWARGGEVQGSPRLLRTLAALGTGAGRRGAPRDLERRIAAAGRPGGLGPRELMAAKLAGALLSGLVGAPLSAAMPGRLGLLAMVAPRWRVSWRRTCGWSAERGNGPGPSGGSCPRYLTCCE